MNPWIWVACGGIFEACWAVTLSRSEGFTVPGWTLATIIINFVSIWSLDYGLKAGTSPGSTYAVWTGCGTVFSTAAGILMGESLGPLQFLFLAMLLSGVLLMQFADDRGRRVFV